MVKLNYVPIDGKPYCIKMNFLAYEHDCQQREWIIPDTGYLLFPNPDK